jgi:tryptophan synthase alpha chain
MSHSIIPYLIINYPDPINFLDSLKVMLQANPDYLEIQLPFSNPVVDGPVIQKADQMALQFPLDLTSVIKNINQIKIETQSTTQLILMSYITPSFDFGIANLSILLSQNGFVGAIIPDLPVNAPEYQKFNQASDCYLIPVISPLTTSDRLSVIKSFLKPNQLIYATARAGLTGSQTDLSHSNFVEYSEFLKKNLAGYKIMLGFGIRTREQVRQVQSIGFMPVVATELISRIDQSWQLYVQNLQQKNSPAEVVANWCREVMT